MYNNAPTWGALVSEFMWERSTEIRNSNLILVFVTEVGMLGTLIWRQLIGEQPLVHAVICWWDVCAREKKKKKGPSIISWWDHLTTYTNTAAESDVWNTFRCPGSPITYCNHWYSPHILLPHLPNKKHQTASGQFQATVTLDISYMHHC